jgi:ferredoxin
MARNLKVTVDKSVCMGNQACIMNAPGAFRLDEGGLSEVADLDAATEEQILDAAFECPVAAISVVDADTGEDLAARL